MAHDAGLKDVCKHMVDMCQCVSTDDEWLSGDDQTLVEFGD
jgi:hypothetical protein